MKRVPSGNDCKIYCRMRWEIEIWRLAVSAQLMRRILVDFAHSRNNLKRGRDARQVSLNEALLISYESSADLVALDDALKALASLDARQNQVVELRFFGGLSVEETAEVLHCIGGHGQAGLEHSQGLALR